MRSDFRISILKSGKVIIKGFASISMKNENFKQNEKFQKFSQKYLSKVFIFAKVFINTNTFGMYSNTNTLHFSQKYWNTNTNTFKNVFEYCQGLPLRQSKYSIIHFVKTRVYIA